MPPIVEELGSLEQQVLLFGGPCSNLRATEALIAEAETCGIPPDRMICTGDVCAYAAEAEETARLVMELGCPVVAGNCERAVGGNLSGCNCNFEDGGTCDLLSKQWFDHAKRETSNEAKAWMLATPDRVTFSHAGRRYAVIHGGASNVSRNIWPITPEAEIVAEIAILEQEVGPVDCVIAGHSGFVFERSINVNGRAVRWINAGTIGLPPHDGDPRTAYTILEHDGSVAFHRLAYDHDGTVRSMEAAGLIGVGLPGGSYHDAMRTGWWPSEDTLPEEMRRGVTALSPA